MTQKLKTSFRFHNKETFCDLHKNNNGNRDNQDAPYHCNTILQNEAYFMNFCVEFRKILLNICLAALSGKHLWTIHLVTMVYDYTMQSLYNTPHYITDLDIKWSCCGSQFFS